MGGGSQKRQRWQLEHNRIPRARYIDPEFLRLEYERLFGNVWQMACRLEEMPVAGDFVEYTIGQESILVVNAGEGKVRAFYNTCAHRGMRLVSGRGHLTEIRCPFHAWCYDLKGQCTYVHEAEDFGPDFSIEKIQLADCHVDTWGGWVFVHLGANPPPLREWLSPVAEALDPFEPERMRYRWFKSTIMPVNWKTATDAFIEAYHVGGTHPQNTRRDRLDHGPADLEELRRAPLTRSFDAGVHSRFLHGVRPGAGGTQTSRVANARDVEGFATLIEYHAAHLLALATKHDVRAARRLRKTELPEGQTAFAAFQELRREEAEAAGIVWPVLDDEQFRAGQGNWHFFPNMVGLFEPGCALGYRIRPNGDDVDSCLFEVWTLELPPEGEEDAVREPEIIEDWREHDGWGLLLPQDFTNFPAMTAGMHSRGFTHIRINPLQESAIMHAHQTADRFLFDDDDTEENS